MPHSNYPPIIQWRRDACNGMYPSAKFLRNAVDCENHLTAHRHKEVFRCDWRLDSIGVDVVGELARCTRVAESDREVAS